MKHVTIPVLYLSEISPFCRPQPWRACRTEPAARPSPVAAAPSAPEYHKQKLPKPGIKMLN